MTLQEIKQIAGQPAYEEEQGMVYQGDCIEVMKRMPTESVNMCITSPPYYSLRMYLKKDHPDYDKQIGLEPTFEQYLNQMLAVIAEIKRVLSKDGSLWWNIGDSFGTDSGSGSKFDKCMMMFPERLSIRMCDEQGWILRQKIVWAKQVYLKKDGLTKGSAMPASVLDRFNNTWEYLYHFTKTKKYYFNLNAVRIPLQVMGVTDLRPSGFIRVKDYNMKFLEKQSGQRLNLQVRDAERKEKIGKYADGVRGWRNGNIDNNKRAKEYKGKFDGNTEAEDFNLPRARTQRKGWNDHLNDLEEGHVKTGERSCHPDGKNIPNVWLINSEPHNFKKELGVEIDHFAHFPQSLCEIPIKASCPPKEICFDPFSGSGTVALVAKKLGRKFIGIELNEEYITLAKARLNQTEKPSKPKKQKTSIIKGVLDLFSIFGNKP